MSFNEYVTEWWEDFIDSHKSDEDFLEDIFVKMGYIKEDIEDTEGSIADFLKEEADPEEIYRKFFGYKKEIEAKGVPVRIDFLSRVFRDALHKIGRDDLSFAKEFVEDMADHCDGYEYPNGFFNDLQYGGCKSGMVGMLIYNSDCKDIYINHIDDLENYLNDLNEEFGDPIKNKDELPHYTFVCWVCYEELAFSIARELFPDEF